MHYLGLSRSNPLMSPPQLLHLTTSDIKHINNLNFNSIYRTNVIKMKKDKIILFLSSNLNI